MNSLNASTESTVGTPGRIGLFVFGVIAAGLLAGCGSDAADGIKPVSRMQELATPQPVSVTAAAAQASEAVSSRIAAATNESATTAVPSSAVVASATTGGTTQIQGIPAPPKTTIHQGGNVLGVAGIAFTIPADWKQTPPSSGLRAAQYAIPGPGGDAELAVFFFGPGQGGSVDQNVQRWVGQFSSADPAKPQLGGEVGSLESGDLKITLVRTEGTYNPGSMGMGDATPRPNYALFGLVVEGGPEGNLFVKVTGPKDTLEKQKEPLENFGRSTRKSSFK
jgi:hypothetical protein